jgi:hypothetical protein
MDYEGIFKINDGNIRIIIITNYNPNPKYLIGEFLKSIDVKKSYKCKGECVECCICLQSVNKKEFVRELNCGHRFHKKCIDKWLVKMSKEQEHISCPICRQNIELR